MRLHQRISIPALIIAVGCAAAGVRPALATELDGPLTGYKLTSWNHIGGITRSEVYAVGQDQEGYLWVGTEGGLSRFDGVRFLAWDAIGPGPLPKGAVRLLCVARDGSLWVSIRQTDGRNVIAHASRGSVRSFGESDGLRIGRPTAIIEDPSGTIWAGGDGGLFEWTGAGWVRESAENGPGSVLAAFRDGSRMLVASRDGIFERSDGKFVRISDTIPPSRRASAASTARDDQDVAAIATDGAGTTFLGDPLTGFRILGQKRSPDLHDKGRGAQLLYDRRGNLWVGTHGQGVWQVVFRKGTTDYALKKTSEATGLPSDVVFDLMEDHDGNIWAGTSDGLCRLVKQDIDQVRNLGIVRAVEAAAAEVWVGASSGASDALISFRRGTPDPLPQRISLGNARLLAMHADSLGRLWVATDRFFARTENGKLFPVPGADSLKQIAWLATDARGSAWIYDARRGLVHAHDRKVSSVALPAGIGALRMIAGYMDRSGRLWTALEDGRVAVVDVSGTRVLDRTSGLTAGVYHTIYEDNDGAIWLGATGGLSRISSSGIATVPTINSFPGEITAVIEDTAGVLWLGTPTGIVRLAKGEFDKAAGDAQHHLVHAVYTRDDGLAGHPLTADWGGSRAIRASDGRLWFVTNSGVTVIDSTAVSQGRRSHPVHVEAIVVDDGRHTADANQTLPRRTSKLEIDYTTLNLTSAYKSQFRYHLDGVDDKWVEAGARQEAFYANLKPGKYRFSVTSTDHQNEWTTPATSIDFVIPPMFYQTTSFYLFAAMCGIATVWMLWRLRVHRLRRGFSLVIAERLRLSREVHDTLLQGMVAVALQCEVIASEPGMVSAAAKDQIRAVRKRIEECIREARRAIADLRQSTADGRDLVASLRATAATAAQGTNLTVDVVVTGTRVRCVPAVQEQLVWIAREAVTNAVRHACATRVQLEMWYQRMMLTLKISDDGSGFDVESARNLTAGYGLIGMRERAESVGGSVKVISRPGAGTLLEVSVPATAHTRLPASS
jgi:signal transduction histidine kinase/ligand-binding sensor domain-containing protein